MRRKEERIKKRTAEESEKISNDGGACGDGVVPSEGAGGVGSRTQTAKQRRRVPSESGVTCDDEKTDADLLLGAFRKAQHDLPAPGPLVRADSTPPVTLPSAAPEASPPSKASAVLMSFGAVQDYRVPPTPVPLHRPLDADSGLSCSLEAAATMAALAGWAS